MERMSRSLGASAAIVGLGLVVCALLISSSSMQVSMGPATLASKRVKPTQADIKTGPSGVPFWGTETVREDKALSKALHHKTVTEILRDGLEVTDIHAGKGAPAAPGDVVKVHYTGKLAKTGKQFDAGTISFKLGAGKVIKGWDQGLQGLRQGGTRMLHVPPSLAYGAKGTPGGPIPGDATLLFSVKLLHVKKARQMGSNEQAMQKHKKLFKQKQAARAAQMKMYSAKLAQQKHKHLEASFAHLI